MQPRALGPTRRRGGKGLHDRPGCVRPDGALLDRSPSSPFPSPHHPSLTSCAKTYAGAPPSADHPTTNGTTTAGGGPDPVALAGLNEAHVKQFEAMGFARTDVIDVLKRLNYRGKNVASVGEDAVVEALLR